MMDRIHEALVNEMAPVTKHLWTPKFPVTFTPVVLDKVFGDGRALLRVTTINSRPRYWYVRGCSSWIEEEQDGVEGEPVIDHIDAIVQAIADQFGGLPNMHDEEEEEEYVDPVTGLRFDPADITYPQIDDRVGTAWEIVDWPDLPGVAMTSHPVKKGVRILPEDVSGYSIKQVIVIRHDLKMRRGKSVSQGAHASGEFMREQLLAVLSGKELTLTQEEIAWMLAGMTKTTVRSDSFEEFEDVRKRAIAAGLKVRTIRDSGRTEFGNKPTITALAIGPAKISTIDTITGGMTLL